MSIQDLRKLIHPVCDTAIQAGKVIKKYYKSKLNISLKENKSPLTQADLESNHVISNSLLKINKNIPILSEESLVDWSIRKNWQTYWLVDPLDGTKEFINENDEFTVNIALIENNHPVLGVIYAPASEVIYFSFKNGGSYKLSIGELVKNENYFDNSFKIQTATKTINDSLTVICSRSHPNYEFEQWVSKNVKQFKLIKKGSSLKFCDIAEGIADLYPRFRPTSEWDIAAGHIILIEAGGKLETANKKEILYNLKENVINPYFIASCKLEL
jgi:3'(2'), 5'-bisphosphate nucleotidase